MTTDDPVREPASEQTPLLRAPSEGGTPLPKEASTKELIWILGSIWLGVFLAALGMKGPNRLQITKLTRLYSQTQQSSQLSPRRFLRPSILSRCFRGWQPRI